MVKDENNFTQWLKKHNVADDASARKYLLYDKSGRRKLINHAELEAFCRKHFDVLHGAAKEKLLRGELVGTEKGHFRLEVLDKELNVVKLKKTNETS